MQHFEMPETAKLEPSNKTITKQIQFYLQRTKGHLRTLLKI
jgi:hypothetical protein